MFKTITIGSIEGNPGEKNYKVTEEVSEFMDKALDYVITNFENEEGQLVELLHDPINNNYYIWLEKDDMVIENKTNVEIIEATTFEEIITFIAKSKGIEKIEVINQLFKTMVRL